MAALGRARLAVLLAAVVLVAGACATAASPGSSASKTIRPSDSAGVAVGPTSPVVGIVTSVDPVAPPSPSASAGKTTKPSGKPKTAPPTASPAPTKVKGFTLLTTAGDTLTFVIGELDNADDFPPDSLYDRMSTEDPIRVDFTVDGDKLVVTHIEDAG